jgi:hypothetical protein
MKHLIYDSTLEFLLFPVQSTVQEGNAVVALGLAPQFFLY